MTDPNAHADLPFVRWKSRQVVSWSLLNLPRLHEFRGALSRGDGASLAGRSVIVVGAGPSLARNGEALRAAYDNGHAIFAVNASDAALRSLGVVPDVMVVRESLDLADQIEASEARCIVADICVNPLTWNALAAQPDRARWFIPCYPRHVQACRQLRVRPLFGGTSALCSAVSLALEWGATEITLAGCDLAFARDGATYHPAAPRGAMRVSAGSEPDLLRFTGDEDDRARCERSGQRAQLTESTFETVDAADWSGPLWTLPTLTSQRAWLATEKERRPWLVARNATEGGAGVPGWQSSRLADVVSQVAVEDNWSPPAGHAVTHEQAAAMRRDLVADARVLEAICREMVDPLGPDMRGIGMMPRAVEGSRLVESLGEWRLLDAPTAMGADRCRYIYDQWHATAREAASLFGEA